MNKLLAILTLLFPLSTLAAPAAAPAPAKKAEAKAVVKAEDPQQIAEK